MKRLLPAIITLLVVIGVIYYGRQPVTNPDPNHTHADFAVWVDGQKLDFSGPEFMSGLSTDDSTHDEEDEVHHKYLHLHDKNGDVIHSHKPGLSILDFLKSLGVTVRENSDDTICLKFPQLSDEVCEGPWHYFFFYTNNPSNGGASFLKDDYVFRDNDKILITNGSKTTSEDIEVVRKQWFTLTDEACLYSKTCPWRGAPPTENCIADPLIPCIAP